MGYDLVAIPRKRVIQRISSIEFAMSGLTETSTPFSYKLFDTTGDLIVTVFSVCEATVSMFLGTPNVSVGTPTQLGVFIPDTNWNNSTPIEAGDVWLSSSHPAEAQPLSNDQANGIVLADGPDIELRLDANFGISTATFTYYCLWVPLSEGAEVIPNASLP